MPSIDDVFASADYLRVADLNQKEHTLNINGYEIQEYDDGKRKPVLSFAGAKKKLVCNLTNARRIAMLHGDDLDGWLGKSITIMPDITEFQGKPTPCIRVKVGMVSQPEAAQAPVETAPTTSPELGDLDDEIPF